MDLCADSLHGMGREFDSGIGSYTKWITDYWTDWTDYWVRVPATNTKRDLGASLSYTDEAISNISRLLEYDYGIISSPCVLSKLDWGEPKFTNGDETNDDKITSSYETGELDAFIDSFKIIEDKNT